MADGWIALYGEKGSHPDANTASLAEYNKLKIQGAAESKIPPAQGIAEQVASIGRASGSIHDPPQARISMKQAKDQPEKNVTGGGTFWNRYVQAVQQEGVPEYQQRWYVIRAREFLKTHAGTRLKEQNTEKFKAYLEGLGRKNKLQDWQFVQIVHSLQILFSRVIRVEWADMIPPPA